MLFLLQITNWYDKLQIAKNNYERTTITHRDHV